MTDEELVKALRETVAKSPEKVYAAPEHMGPMETPSGGTVLCFYVHTDPETGEAVAPGCMVGAALHSLGVPLEKLKLHEGEAARKVLYAVTNGEVRYETTELYAIAQSYQDAGRTWGDALRYAEGDDK